MHELSIAQNILAIATRSVPAGEPGVVSGISLKIGELSSIEIDALRFAFSVIRQNSILENAELDIEVIPGEAVCMSCREIFPIHAYGACCPHCGSYALQVQKGKDLKITSLTIDDQLD